MRRTPGRDQIIVGVVIAALFTTAVVAAVVHEPGGDEVATDAPGARPGDGDTGEDDNPDGDVGGTGEGGTSSDTPTTTATGAASGSSSVGASSATTNPSRQRTTTSAAAGTATTTKAGPDTVGARPCQATKPPISLSSGNAAFSTKEHGLYAIKVDGSSAHRVAVSPTGRTFYGVSFEPNGYQFVASDDLRMWVGDVTRNAEQAVEIGAGLVNPTTPAWSPDSRTIAVSARAGDVSTPYVLWLMTPDGKNRRQVPGTPPYAGQPTWSPDSQWIAFTVKAGDVWVVRPDGTGLRRLVTGTTPRSLSWGRNTELAVTGDIDGKHGLHVVRFDGAHRLLTAMTGEVAWSPDCSSILSTGERVSLLDPADGNRRDVAGPTPDVHYSSPSWAPDARGVVVTSSRKTHQNESWKDDRDVVLMSNGVKRTLVDMDGSGWVAHARGWSPQGDWLLVCIGTY